MRVLNVELQQTIQSGEIDVTRQQLVLIIAKVVTYIRKVKKKNLVNALTWSNSNWEIQELHSRHFKWRE